MAGFGWLGKGEVIGAGVMPGVPLLEIEGFVTIGVSFQLTISLDLDGGGCDGAGFLGGPPSWPYALA